MRGIHNLSRWRFKNHPWENNKKTLRGGVRACNNLPQPNPYILVFGGCGRLLHALTPPRSVFLYLQFLARCHPYILLHFYTCRIIKQDSQYRTNIYTNM